MANLAKIPLGKNAPKEVYCVMETTKGSKMKYEYDEGIEAMKFKRCIEYKNGYPADYGFVTSTLAEDGDPLDIMIISEMPLQQGCVIEARPIGFLEMEDQNGIDRKIIAVPVKDHRYDGVKDISDVSKEYLDEIVDFFTNYKKADPARWSKVQGWKGAKDAFFEVEKCAKRAT